MNKVNIGILIFLTLCTVLIIPTNATNKVYLVPQQSNATYSNTTIVQIWAKTTDNFESGQINLTYTQSCADITGWQFCSLWQGLPPNLSENGRFLLVFYKSLPAVNGTFLIGNLTIFCCNESICETPLEFSPPRYLAKAGNPLSVMWINGTFTCGELQQCLGTCCNDSSCSDAYLFNVTCHYCLGIDGEKYWKPNQDSACFDGNSPSNLCLNYCPQCCNADDDDEDGAIDFPADKQCTCGLDPSEANPAPPVPELPTIALFSLGLLALTGYVLRKRA